MAVYSFLKRIPLFAELPESDLQSLCEMVEQVELKAGEQLFSEGDPGNHAYVIREGELEVLKASQRRDVLLAVRTEGEVIGEMALLEDTTRTATVRARTDVILLRIDKSQLDYLLETSSSAARVLFYTILRRWRETHAALRQSEKMAELGRMTAGVAHELNNPAAAAGRSASQLQELIASLTAAQAELTELHLQPPAQALLDFLKDKVKASIANPLHLDTITRSDREAELEDWLEGQGIQDAWELAPALVGLELDPQARQRISTGFSAAELPAVLTWVQAACDVENLLVEIREAAGRISTIVQALKSYSYLDQAPVQEVDIQAGLENTLVIMRHKLKQGIEVKREYAEDLPHIQGHGSELNQVWTNLIDNAADAMQGRGTLILRTKREKDWVVVEIEDDGPGIPPEIQDKVFDPFFTTRPPGQGTGLGLDISYNIIVHKHRGEIKLFSKPGQTIFRVSLPIEAQLAE